MMGVANSITTKQYKHILYILKLKELCIPKDWEIEFTKQKAEGQSLVTEMGMEIEL